MVALVWVSARISLFGPEITRACSVRRRSWRTLASVVVAANADREENRWAGCCDKPDHASREVAAWILVSSWITLFLDQMRRLR